MIRLNKPEIAMTLYNHRLRKIKFKLDKVLRKRKFTVLSSLSLQRLSDNLNKAFRAFNPETTTKPKEAESNITFKVPKNDWKPKLKPVRRRHNDYLTRRNRFDNLSIDQLLYGITYTVSYTV